MSELNEQATSTTSNPISPSEIAEQLKQWGDRTFLNVEVGGEKLIVLRQRDLNDPLSFSIGDQQFAVLNEIELQTIAAAYGPSDHLIIEPDDGMEAKSKAEVSGATMVSREAGKPAQPVRKL